MKEDLGEEMLGPRAAQSQAAPTQQTIS